MNNERLAALISEGGNDELLPILWEKMRRFYRMQAKKYAARYSEQCAKYGITADDLQQEGYLSMLETVKSYTSKDTDAAFITFCGYQFLNKCASLIGIRAGHRTDALNRCTVSLNEPLENKDRDTDGERGDLIEDQDAGAPFDNIERGDLSEKVRQVIAETLTDEREREIIERHFYGGETYKGIAAAEGISAERVRQIRQRAYNHLRNNKHLQELAEIDYYQHIGTAAAQRGGSIEERIAEYKERRGLLAG